MPVLLQDGYPLPFDCVAIVQKDDPILVLWVQRNAHRRPFAPGVSAKLTHGRGIDTSGLRDWDHLHTLHVDAETI